MRIPKMPKVENFTSSNGNRVANQFRIWVDEGVVFQSYGSIIAFAPYIGKKQLDKDYWDYSVTTGKYRNQFLGEPKAVTLKKIKSGEYELADLNKD